MIASAEDMAGRSATDKEEMNSSKDPAGLKIHAARSFALAA